MLVSAVSAIGGESHDSAAWQKSRAEARARSGNPKLNWRHLTAKSPQEGEGTWRKQRQENESSPTNEAAEPVNNLVSEPSAKASAAVAPTPKKRVVPSARHAARPRITLREVAATSHEDDQVAPAGAPLLRSALQPKAQSAVLEDEVSEDDLSDEDRSYDELPTQDETVGEVEMPQVPAAEDDPVAADEESRPRFRPRRTAPPADLDEPADESDKPGLLPEPATKTKSAKLTDCDKDCPSQNDPSMFRALMEISLNMSDPTQDLSDAPSDYEDADGLGPDDPVFTQGEKFVPRPSFRRCWNDASGTQFQGWYVKHKDGQVLIIDEDKVEHWIPVGQLSLRDRRYLYHLPTECVLADEQFVPRTWCLTNYTWKASALCHKPLYFEQVNYERYGHTWGPLADPVLQGAHFFTSIAFLPYNMGVEPATECIYPLGYYRPNSCAPYMLFPIPISARGALFQAGAVTGVWWLFH